MSLDELLKLCIDAHGINSSTRMSTDGEIVRPRTLLPPR